MKYSIAIVIAVLLVVGCTSRGPRELSGEDLAAVKALVDLQQFDLPTVPQDADYRCPSSMTMLAEEVPGWSGLVYKYGKGNIPLRNMWSYIDEPTDMLICLYSSNEFGNVQGNYAMPYPPGVTCDPEGNRNIGFSFDCRVPGVSPD